MVSRVECQEAAAGRVIGQLTAMTKPTYTIPLYSWFGLRAYVILEIFSQ